jgi:hypothetical protein
MTLFPAFTASLALLALQPAPPAGANRNEDAEHVVDKLPAPLDGVAVDFSQIENLFRVADVSLFAPDEFRVGDRVVAEETIVWTLEARVRLTGAQIYRLFHNPHPRVSFFKSADDRQVSADARPDGYHLMSDLRWFRLKPAGEDLAAGERMEVWVHLGPPGSRGLLASGATEILLRMD